MVKDWSPVCPSCKGYMTYIHDIKCPVCDNKTIAWCPKCQHHVRMKGDITNERY